MLTIMYRLKINMNFEIDLLRSLKKQLEPSLSPPGPQDNARGCGLGVVSCLRLLWRFQYAGKFANPR